MMYTLISKFAIIPPKTQFVKIRKIEADSDSDRGKNHTCTDRYFIYVFGL